MARLEDWLHEIGLGEHAAAFAAQHIDFDTVSDLNDADFKELGLSIGHRKLLRRALQALQAAAQGSPAPLERRYMTVAFCDIVGSSALSERFEGEDVVDLIQHFREVCGASIARYEGTVSRYIGDGILFYFGHPVAHEDDAERAVRAADRKSVV